MSHVTAKTPADAGVLLTEFSIQYSQYFAALIEKTPRQRIDGISNRKNKLSNCSAAFQIKFWPYHRTDLLSGHSFTIDQAIIHIFM